jgi:hypothetical protein
MLTFDQFLYIAWGKVCRGKKLPRWAIDAQGSGRILGSDEGNAWENFRIGTGSSLGPEQWLVESWSGLKIAVPRLGDVRRAIGCYPLALLRPASHPST